MSIVALAVLYTWIQQGTCWVVAAAAAFHTAGNTAGEYFPVDGGARWIALGVVVLLATSVAVRWRLSRTG